MQFDALLNSSDAEARANLLQGTAYALEADQLRQVQVVEQALMKHLLAEYDWAYQVAPNPAVVDLFALKYTYHNLKVYLKHKATERKLGALIDPYRSLFSRCARAFGGDLFCGALSGLYGGRSGCNLARIPRLSGLASPRNWDGLSLF